MKKEELFFLKVYPFTLINLLLESQTLIAGMCLTPVGFVRLLKECIFKNVNRKEKQIYNNV